MSRKQFISSQLNNAGFNTEITFNEVIVSLNRHISKMEVETALEQVAPSIEFTLERVTLGKKKGIMVKV